MLQTVEEIPESADDDYLLLLAQHAGVRHHQGPGQAHQAEDHCEQVSQV